MGHRYEDITTLPKSMYYLEHLVDRSGSRKIQHAPFKIIKGKNYCCDKCYSNKPVEGKRRDVGLRIPSRRYEIQNIYGNINKLGNLKFYKFSG